jgi:P-type Cu+ transporter
LVLARRKEYSVQKDPVCGMSIDPNDAESSTHQGKTYYFCSEDCKTKFDKQPAQYANKQKEPAA